MIVPIFESFTTSFIQFGDHEIICVSIPEKPAICAAIIFVEKPPIPFPDEDLGIRSFNSSELYSIFSIFFASSIFSGSESNKPSLSVITTNLSALSKIETIAESLSLSPNFNSSVATTSFSLITGIIFFDMRPFKASVVLMNWFLSSSTFFEMRT